jgi:acyl-CoA thioesterase-1
MISLSTVLRRNRSLRSIVGKRIHVSITFLLIFLVGCASESSSPGRVQGGGDGSPSTTETVSNEERRRILFFGDSITAGYGLDPNEAFPALVQDMIDDRGWPYEAVNAGLSGETTAGGLRRIDWMLNQPVDVFVLELGGNDGLRGIPVSATRQNLLDIVDKVKTRYPETAVVVAGMRIPPNLGRQFAERFANVFPEVAEETGSTLIPFIGEDVLGRRLLVQLDGVHPTAAGHEVIAETVWKYLEPVLLERLNQDVEL